MRAFILIICNADSACITDALGSICAPVQLTSAGLVLFDGDFQLPYAQSIIDSCSSETERVQRVDAFMEKQPMKR